MIFLSRVFFRNTNGIPGIDLVRIGNVVQPGKLGYSCSESGGNFTQGISRAEDIGNIVRFRPGRPFGEMIQPGISDYGRVIRKSPVQVNIPSDSGYTALAGVLPYAAAGAIETFTVSGVPELRLL